MVDLRLPLLRGGAVLPWRCEASTPALPDLTAAEIMHAARSAGERPGAFLLGGGDPLRRSDLATILGELARLRPDHLGVCSAGHGITAVVAQRLRGLGVQRVQVPFHCARQDAHDWVVGQAGALKTVHRAIRACADAGLAVTAEIVLTRPTLLHLAETVEVLARLGVRTLCVRRLTADDVDGAAFVTLSPRLELLQESLERAATVALERRVRLLLRDLPPCVAPRLRPLFAAPDSELWISADGRVGPRGVAGLGCATCPGGQQCAGAPRDYVARFGWEELVDSRSAEPRVHETVKEQQTPGGAQPMAFSWRGPRRVRCEACAETRYDGPRGPQPYESTRVVRARLVQAARYRPPVLRLVGADLLAHPHAAALLYDALRLFRHVEVAGEASPVGEWSDLDFRRLKELRRIDVALYGPDAASHDAHCGIPGAFAAMLRGVERLREANVPVGAYAILHDARWTAAFAEAWSRGALPGTPRFRLSGRGASLDQLAQGAQALPPGPARSALAAVVPRCPYAEEPGETDETGTPVISIRHDTPQQRIHCGRRLPYEPCGSDPIGAFVPCQDGAEACPVLGCPGTAVGWQSTARTQRWSKSN